MTATETTASAALDSARTLLRTLLQTADPCAAIDIVNEVANIDRTLAELAANCLTNRPL